MTLPFSKYQATGNDFILIDNRFLNLHLSTEQVSRLCHRRWGIGADGLILLQNHPNADFEMVYYNADGKIGSFCGNGSRAAVRFAKDIGILPQNKAHFIAYDGLHYAELLAHHIKIQMKPIQHFKVLGPQEFFLDTGSPHHVKWVENVWNYPVLEEGKTIRNSEKYQPHGTNVNFVSTTNEGIEVRTYERGVEEETYSCGTGVTATAYCYLYSQNKEHGEVTVLTRGGKLKVSFLPDQTLFLEGPAQPVFSGQIPL